MAQKRYFDFQTPIADTKLREVQYALNNYGRYRGYDITVIDLDSVALAPNGYLLLKDGAVVSETASVELRIPILPNAATEYTVVCQRAPNSQGNEVIGGSPATYAILLGLYGEDEVVNGIVIGWIHYPGGGGPLLQEYIEMAESQLKGRSPWGPAGGDLSDTYPNPTVAGIGGIPLDLEGLIEGNVLVYVDGAWVPAEAGGDVDASVEGDLSGSLPDPVVVGLQGRPVSEEEPTEGQALSWDGSEWSPQDVEPSLVPELSFTGATNETTTLVDTEIVIGGLVFDSRLWDGYDISVLFYGLLRAPDSAANGIFRLYDMGTPGDISAGVLRSTIFIGNISQGVHTRIQNGLTPSNSPGVDSNEIQDDERMYEMRLVLEGGDPGDSFTCLNGSLRVVPTPPQSQEPIPL